jgi:putative component of toxin-antitoxin plasmid stabilization module
MSLPRRGNLEAWWAPRRRIATLAPAGDGTWAFEVERGLSLFVYPAETVAVLSVRDSRLSTEEHRTVTQAMTGQLFDANGARIGQVKDIQIRAQTEDGLRPIAMMSTGAFRTCPAGIYRLDIDNGNTRHLVVAIVEARVATAKIVGVLVDQSAQPQAPTGS